MTDESLAAANIPTLAPSHARLADAREIPRAVENALAALGHPNALTVLVNDPQRHTASPPVLAALAGRIDPAAVHVLVAASTHRFAAAQRAAFEERLRGGGASHSPPPPGEFAWHDALADGLVAIGPWHGHPWLLADRPLLAVGSVEPHYFAGYTGAHKTSTIGCAAYDDVQSNHAAALSPACRPAVLSGNPVHAGVLAMLAALEARQSLAAVNLIQAGADVLGAFGGTVKQTLHAAADLAGDAFVRHIDEPADALVLEVTGPLANTFYQADKGIKNNEWAVRDGGCLVLVASCGGGIGQDHFVELLRAAPTHAQALSIIERRGYRLGDHKAVRLRRLTDPASRGVRVMLVSEGLSADDARTLGFLKVATVAQALSAAGVEPPIQRVYRVRDAGNCVVAVAEPQDNGSR